MCFQKWPVIMQKAGCLLKCIWSCCLGDIPGCCLDVIAGDSPASHLYRQRWKWPHITQCNFYENWFNTFSERGEKRSWRHLLGFHIICQLFIHKTMSEWTVCLVCSWNIFLCFPEASMIPPQRPSNPGDRYALTLLMLCLALCSVILISLRSVTKDQH